MTESDELDAIKQRKLQQLTATNRTSESENHTERRSNPASEPIQIGNHEDLEVIVEQHPVVLVDFYADWCGPCKMLAPTIEQLAKETPAAVGKINIDTAQQLAAEYGVRGVPTVVLFADGQPVEQLVGVRGKDQYEQLIQQYAT